MVSGNMTMKMEVDIVSKTIIKPSLPQLDHFKPFKLSILDQVFPSIYSPLILFYPSSSVAHFTSAQLSTKLKNSLSEALAVFYPLSGRLVNNLYIDHYEEGVPYIEARVNCNLMDFLQHPQMESLNQFLPCQPLRYEPNPNTLPQVTCQMNFFGCGGIAIGLCGSHKLMDGTAWGCLLKYWTSLARGSSYYPNHNKLTDNSQLLQSAALHFPPDESSSYKYLSIIESTWFGNKGNLKTRRFVFDAKAMAAIRVMSRSQGFENPSRTEALSAFICKYAMTASNDEASDYLKPSFITQAVNIRRKLKPRMSTYCLGNLVWSAKTMANSAHETKIELPTLVEQMNESIKKINSDFVDTLRGKEGCSEIYRVIEEMEEIHKKKLDVYNLSSLIKIGFNEIDFGWGKPIWVGFFGEVSDEVSRSFIFLKDLGSNNAVEVWLTLKAKQMEILENDPEFLKFASPNPSILIP